MKKGILVFILIGIIMGVMLVSSVDAEKVSKEVYKTLEGNDKVRVIVKINEDTDRRIMILGNEMKKNKKEEIKKNIINKINKKNIKHVFSDSIAMEVSRKELDRLEEERGVESVSKESFFHTFLQDSIPLINASVVHKTLYNNYNLTGKNQSICIIDTGVDYNHPDLGGCYGGNDPNSDCKIIGGYDYCADDTDCSIEDSNPMDVNGHGTHVTGIVGAGGSITGVAPDSKIVMIKAANSTGSFPTSNIKAGIKWCVNNASKFNISVISMSLGGGLYSGYCDESWDGDNPPVDVVDLVTPINNATAHNLSVIVSSGNDGSTSKISSPACIQNSTAISSIRKDDFTFDYNRNNLTDLIAPGYDINSTKYGGGYISHSGTSMAAPMVSGAIAIINQYLEDIGKNKTPWEIESTLNNTGKRINDTEGTNLNFSRINIYSAILSLDETSPNVSLISPENDSSQFSQNVSFNCSAEDWQLKNVSLQVWNSSGDLVNTSSENMSGESNYSEFNLNLSYGEYEWNCLVYDEENNPPGFASMNNTLEIYSFRVELNSPSNNSYTNINETEFNCSAETQKELSNMTFYLWNSTNLIYNETKNISGILNSTIFKYNLTNESTYYWNCLSYDNVSNSSWANNNFTITYDITNPNLTIVSSPSDSTGASTKTFEYNVSDNNLANCSLIIDGSINMTNSPINQSVTQSFTKSFSVGNYNWKINCSDYAGNINYSSGSFTISEPLSDPNSGSPSGGSPSVMSVSLDNETEENETEGGTSGQTYSVSSSEASSGYTKPLKEKDKVKFKFDNKTKFYDKDAEEHTLTVNEVKNDSVNITIKSKPINFLLGIGQSVKLNLTSPDYYDLYVKLNSIENGSAEITIQTINEPISTPRKNIEAIRFKIISISLILIFIIVAILILWKERKNLPISKKAINEYREKFREHLHPEGKGKKNKEKPKENEKEKKNKKS